jgi:hypothetical protein
MKTFNHDKDKNYFPKKRRVHFCAVNYENGSKKRRNVFTVGKYFFYISSIGEKHNKYTPNFQDCEEFFYWNLDKEKK